MRSPTSEVEIAEVPVGEWNRALVKQDDIPQRGDLRRDDRARALPKFGRILLDLLVERECGRVAFEFPDVGAVRGKLIEHGRSDPER